METRVARWPEMSTLSIVVMLLTVGLLPLAPTGSATHNSAGTQLAVLEPDEVEPSGELRPDADHLRMTFHRDADRPRQGPADQTGDRYRRCTPWSEYDLDGDGVQDVAGYDDDLRHGDACYVGYIDVQWLYAIPARGSHRTQDQLYPANPNRDDGYCSGDEGPAVPEEPPEGVPSGVWPGGHVIGEGNDVDNAVAGARRSNETRCQGSAHDRYGQGDLLVDTDIVEWGISDAGDVLGQDDGSGPVTQPLFVRPYVFLFGQPHPANARPSDLEAGEGPFGPLELGDVDPPGSPLVDLTGACGDRTKACVLLTPEDVRLYDRDQPAGSRDVARVCGYLPQFQSLSPRWWPGPCGGFGHRFAFQGDTHKGGAETDTGVPTWVSNLPGWTLPWYLWPGGTASNALQAAGAMQDADEDVRSGLAQIVAVNPRVPERVSDLWCVRPNVLTTGSDPVYGDTYDADAIDYDLYRGPLHDRYEELEQTTTPDAQPASSPVEDVLETEPQPRDTEAPERTFSVTYGDGVACDPNGNLHRRDASVTRHGEVHMDAHVRSSTVELKDPTPGDLPPSIEDAWDRDGVQNSGWKTDAYTIDGTLQGVVDADGDGSIEPCQRAVRSPEPDRDRCVWRPIWDAYDTFSACRDCGETLSSWGYDVEEGVGLVATVEVRGPVAVQPRDGATHTHRYADAELPPAGRWAADVKRAVETGHPAAIFAEVDEILDESGLRSLLHLCDPGTDADGCSSSPFTLRTDDGLTVFAGSSDGPVSTTAYAQVRNARIERTVLLGDDGGDPFATNCIVATSAGFVDKLADLRGAGSDDALLDELCGDADGERLLLENGFVTQDPRRTPGMYGSNFRWVRTLPVTSTGQLAQVQAPGGAVCVSAILHVDAGVDATEDTEGHVGLGSGEHVFRDCDGAGNQPGDPE